MGYLAAHGEVEAERLYASAITVRTAVWGKPEDLNALRPRRARRGDTTSADDDYDEDGLAEELAALGFYEVPR